MWTTLPHSISLFFNALNWRCEQRQPTNSQPLLRLVQLVMEGNIPNLDVTAPGGILGLALMYLQTDDRSIADCFAIPRTAFDLDLVRPDFILLRMLARSLVMWGELRPTQEWLVAQLPPLIRVRPASVISVTPCGVVCK